MLQQTTSRLEVGEILGFYRGYTSYEFEHNDLRAAKKQNVVWHALSSLGDEEDVPSDVLEAEYKFRMVRAFTLKLFFD